MKVILTRKAVDFETESKTKLFLGPGQQTKAPKASNARKNLYQRYDRWSISR